MGINIFADLKISNEPEEMANMAECSVRRQVDVLSISSIVTKEAIRAMHSRVKEIKENERKMIILAEIISPSFSNGEMTEVYKAQLQGVVGSFAKRAYEENLDGIILPANSLQYVPNYQNLLKIVSDFSVELIEKIFNNNASAVIINKDSIKFLGKYCRRESEKEEGATEVIKEIEEIAKKIHLALGGTLKDDIVKQETRKIMTV